MTPPVKCGDHWLQCADLQLYVSLARYSSIDPVTPVLTAIFGHDLTVHELFRCYDTGWLDALLLLCQDIISC